MFFKKIEGKPFGPPTVRGLSLFINLKTLLVEKILSTETWLSMFWLSGRQPLSVRKDDAKKSLKSDLSDLSECK